MENQSKGNHWLLKLVGAVALTVVTLNIQRVAEAVGLDRFLLWVVESGPNWLKLLTEVVTSDVAFFISIAVASFVLGLSAPRIWAWIKKRTARREVDPEELADQCNRIAPIVRACASLVEYPAYLPIKLRIELWDIGKSLGIEQYWAWENWSSEEAANKTAASLEQAATLVRAGDLEAAKALLLKSRNAAVNIQDEREGGHGG